MTLPERWRAARPPDAGLHLDSAACSRQSLAAIDAAAAFARREAAVGGYVAAQEAEPILTSGRRVVAALIGMAADDVVFTTGASHALDLLLSAWPGERRVIDCLPNEFGPNLAVMAANGFEVRPLSVDRRATDPPTMAHLTVVGSHRGTLQPVAEIAAACREQGVPLVVDAAQGLGHVDCAVDADAIYSTSRKWLAGPRGVGVLAVRPELASRLEPRLPPPGWMRDIPSLRALDLAEANIAARVGFSVAATEHMDEGPATIRARLAEVGRTTRVVLSVVPGWRVVEPEETPTAITTLAPTFDVDLVKVRAELIKRHGIVTTVAEPQRAPWELTAPVLRVSPHVDVTGEELERFAGLLRSVCAQ